MRGYLLTVYLLVVKELNCASHALNYCDQNKRLCNLTGYQHITCESNGAFSPLCPPKARIIQIDQHIEQILDEHNKKRNEIAGGKTMNFNTAAKMPTIVSRRLNYLFRKNQLFFCRDGVKS